MSETPTHLVSQRRFDECDHSPIIQALLQEGLMVVFKPLRSNLSDLVKAVRCDLLPSDLESPRFNHFAGIDRTPFGALLQAATAMARDPENPTQRAVIDQILTRFAK